MSFIFILTSLGSMSHVDFKKWPCRRVEFKGQDSQYPLPKPQPPYPLMFTEIRLPSRQSHLARFLCFFFFYATHFATTSNENLMNALLFDTDELARQSLGKRVREHLVTAHALAVNGSRVSRFKHGRIL